MAWRGRLRRGGGSGGGKTRAAVLRADWLSTRRFECDVEHLVDRHDGVERHRVAHILGNVIQVGAVALGEDHVGQTRGVRGKHLLLQAADRQDPALQRHLAGHADGVAHGPVR